MSDPKYPEIFVQLSGEDGNMGAIMARVNRAFKQYNRDAGEHAVSTDEQNEFRRQIFGAGSYDEALNIVQRWVEVA